MMDEAKKVARWPRPAEGRGHSEVLTFTFYHRRHRGHRESKNATYMKVGDLPCVFLCDLCVSVSKNTHYALPTRSPLRPGLGVGMLGLSDLLAAEPPNPLAPKKPHFPGKAKHVVHLFMNGGPVARRYVRSQAAARQVSTASRCRSRTCAPNARPAAAMRSPFKFHEVRQERHRGQRTVRRRRPDTSTTCASSARCTPTCRITNRR